MRLRFAAILLALVGLQSESSADELFTVTKDTLLFSSPGSLVRVVDPGAEGLTWHAFEADLRGNFMVRLNGLREDGTDDWEIYSSPPVYLCPTVQMIPGLVWQFPVDDLGFSRSAKVVGQEAVSVPAGDFLNAWRVDVTRDDQPGIVVQTLWFAVNVGIVKQVEFENGVPVWRSELQSYDVSGLGFFPLLVGNSWQYADVSVAGRARSLGALKGSFVD
jgi:hypothetical protein